MSHALHGKELAVPFAAQFGEETPSKEFFLDKEGNQIVEMSNPTRIFDQGDEAS